MAPFLLLLPVLPFLCFLLSSLISNFTNRFHVYRVSELTSRATQPKTSTQEMEAWIWSILSFIEQLMFGRLCSSHCENSGEQGHAPALTEHYWRRSQTVEKLTSRVNDVSTSVYQSFERKRR